ISKAFVSDKGALPVVDAVGFGVGDGEFVAIIGPSGCGKTTLMNMIAGFLRPDHGAVFIDGIERRKPDSKGILISQHGSVFPWLTVQENLMFGLNGHASLDRVDLADHYAEIVGLKGFETSYPHELSGGMLKRAELARALVVKPEILYMDEPFSALDALMSLRIRNELLRILSEERHTVMLITHDVEEAIHLADRIMVLSPRPASIQAKFDVPFAHPRKLTSPDAQELRVAVLRELGAEGRGVTLRLLSGVRALDDLDVDHHEDDLLQPADVLQRVAGDRNDVGKLAGLDSTDAVVPAAQFRADPGACLYGFGRCHAGFDEHRELARENDGVDGIAAEIDAGRDLDSAFVGAPYGREEDRAVVGGVVVLLVLGEKAVAFGVVITDIDGGD